MPDDNLTLTLRVHDPKEKQDHDLSTAWVVVKVERTDIGMKQSDFTNKYINPYLLNLKPLKLS